METEELKALDDQFAGVFEKIFNDPRYHEGLKYGVPRKGHPEGTVGKHLVDLQCNLIHMRLGGIVEAGSIEYQKLLLLIHVHDIMKYAATPDSPIIDQNSHASLARKFLAEFLDDDDLQNIVQAHDENLALWQQQKNKGKYSVERMKERVIDKIEDIDTLLLFQLIDGFTEGKTDMRSMLRWFVGEVASYRHVSERVFKALELFGL
jgi:hypothetical protein